MTINPCIGMDKAHEADPNANREWFTEEWQFARERAPLEVKIPLMLARYAGLRGQTIVVVNWKQYHAAPLTGSASASSRAKNKEKGFLPAMPELQTFLAELKVRAQTASSRFATTARHGRAKRRCRPRVSHWLRDREREA